MRVRTVRDLAVAIRGRRTDLGLNQAELARRAGVSRKWVYEFEAGKPTAELALVIRVLEELGLDVEVSASTAAHPTPPAGVAVVDLDALLDEHRDQ